MVITAVVLVIYVVLSLFLFHLSKQSGDIDVAALLMLAILLITLWTDGTTFSGNSLLGDRRCPDQHDFYPAVF